MERRLPPSLPSSWKQTRERVGSALFGLEHAAAGHERGAVVASDSDQTYSAQHRSQIRLHPRYALNVGEPELVKQIIRGHRLAIRRPESPQSCIRRSLGWAPRLLSGEVSDQESLVVVVLQDQIELPAGGQSIHLLISLVVVADPVLVQEHESPAVGTSLQSLSEFLDDLLDNGQWISTPTVRAMQVDVKPLAIGKTLQEECVGVLAISFAPDEESGALRNRASHHPTCGSAPNAPLKYF
jgi:hypothetical protein